MFELRSYQVNLINRIVNSMRKGNRTIIVQSPPRTGKTVVMAEIARRTTLNNKNVMFLIHRKEVLDQAKNTFEKQGVKPELLTAGMVQTLSRRIDKLTEPRLILVDEAHHALAKSYRKILDKFSNAYILLFTATPIRLGNKQLDEIADDIVLGQSIKELTEQGFLAPFRYFQPPSDFSKSKLKKNSTGDFSKESMDEALSNKLYGHIVKQYQRIASGLQAVVYTHSVESAIRVANEFNDTGIVAAEVDGNTLPDKRDEIVNKFRDKKIKILVNVNLFTEGVDLPDVDCVIMARPTTSLALYLQFSMRCLNPREGKTAIIIDHAANFKKFGYPDSDRDWKLAIKSKGKRTSKNNEEELGISIATCDYCFAVVETKDIKDGKCPVCEHTLKVPEKAKKIADVDLIEAKEERARLAKELAENKILQKVATKSVNELTTHAELKAYAKLHGYKNGWVYYMSKRKGIFK